MGTPLDREKEIAAIAAVAHIRDGQTVGLGTGSSSAYAIREIGRLVKDGLRISGVPTSVRTAELAKQYGIPLVDIQDVNVIDITIDGADEFTSDRLLIKGGGGALFREKIVASLTRQQIIIADSSKKVDKLGKFRVPVELAPFAWRYVLAFIEGLGGKGGLRQKGASTYTTDQGNYIIDLDFGLIDDPRSLAVTLNQIEGVVCHGIFIDLATVVLMGQGEEVISF